MDAIFSFLPLVGFIILGFLIAEFQNAFLGKQTKDINKLYFTFIGVEFTQKDAQRLVLALGIGIGVMFVLPKLTELTGYGLDGNIIYMITGYSPSTVMMFVKKKIKNKVK